MRWGANTSDLVVTVLVAVSCLLKRVTEEGRKRDQG